MTTTSRTSQSASAPVKTPIPTPKRFIRCIACGTTKKERSYALCAECYRTSGTLPKNWFTCFARDAEREAPQYSYRNDPRFEQACRVYARRRQRAEKAAAILAQLPILRRGRVLRDRRDLRTTEAYDGFGPYELIDLVDAQNGAELPTLERSAHREFTDAEIAAWDARVDAWLSGAGSASCLSLLRRSSRGGTPWRSPVPSCGPTIRCLSKASAGEPPGPSWRLSRPSRSPFSF